MKRLLIIAALTVLGNSIIPAERVEPTDSNPKLTLSKVTVPETKSITLADSKALAEVANIKAPVVVQTAPQAYAAPAGDAKAFIYSHESGNNPGSVNASSGACGLGQALPCSKMPCSMSDYGCQDNFFTQYMSERYGSWENARSFWLQHSWW